MRSVIQRVRSARVTVGERVAGAIGRGLLVLVGVEAGDGMDDVQYTAGKVRDMRIFEDDDEAAGDTNGGGDGRRRMHRSVADIGGSVLLVSQFTLLADVHKGRRPSFDAAAPPEVARARYEELVGRLRASGLPVETGEFQAMMIVTLENDGPVTMLLDSRRRR